MKNKGSVELMAIGLLGLIAVAIISLMAYPKITGRRIDIPIISDIAKEVGLQEEEGFGMKCLGKRTDGTYYIFNCGKASPASIIGGSEGVYGLRFTLTVQNSGWTGTPKQYDTITILSKSNSGTDFSGDLYQAFKNGATTPAVKTNIAPGASASWDTGVGTCDSTVGEFSALGYCWIPTDQAINGHGAYETLCSSGCTWQSQVNATYTYGGKTKSITGSNSVSATITPDPIAGIVVTLTQFT